MTTVKVLQNIFCKQGFKAIVMSINNFLTFYSTVIKSHFDFKALQY